MNDPKRTVTMKGKPLVLAGTEVKVGQPAPDFQAVANDMSTVNLGKYRGKVCVLCTVPSLDTPVCDIEARRFNKEAGELGPDVAVLVISMDLPFAQKRWCGAAGVSAVQTLSDHRHGSVGRSYGVLIEDLRLLARAVFVVDREGKVQYAQVVNEITQEPDYAAALSAIRELTGAARR